MAQTPEADSHGVPIYRFQGGYLKDWLVLGPVDQGTEYADPLESLGEIRIGQEVTFPDGQKRTWTPISADDRGVVSLSQFVYQAVAAGVPTNPNSPGILAERVVYAYCQLEEAAGLTRQIMMGMDDGARVWLDDVQVVSDLESDWLSLYEHAFPVDFENTPRRGLLLEVHNTIGDYEFACYGGRSVQGKAVFLDGITPAGEVFISVSVPGETTQAVITDTSGRFQIAAIPYGIAPTLRCLATTAQPTSIEKQELSNAGGLETIEITVSRKPVGGISKFKLPTPPGRFVAVAERPDGILLLANDTDKTIYCYNGLRTYQHPNTQLHRFTNAHLSEICVGRRGELWIATEDDGLFRLAENSLYHWPADRIGRRLGAMHAAANGDLLIGFKDGEAADKCPLFRIPHASNSLVEISTPYTNKSVRAFFEKPLTAGEDQPTASKIYAVFDTGDILLIDDASGFALTPPAGADINAMTEDGDGNLWFAGRSLFSLDKAGNWTETPWSSVNTKYEHGFVGKAQDNTLWAIAGSGVYLVQDNTLIRTAIPVEGDEAHCACLSESGALYLPTGSAGVWELRRSQLRKFGPRDGVASSRGVRVSATADGVVLCSEDIQPILATDHQVEMLDLSGLTQKQGPDIADQAFEYALRVVGLSEHRLLAFPMLQQRVNVVDDYSTLLPRLKQPDGSWQELKCAAWSDTLNRYTFCSELDDGRVVIGTAKGIVELVDDRLVPSHILDDYPGVVPDALAAMQAEDKSLWIALCGGHIVNVRNGKSQTFVLPFESVCGATNIAEFNKKIWIGNADGLFYVDQPAGQVHAFQDPGLSAQAVVGLETSIIDEQMWIVTRPGTVLAMRNDETTTEVPIFEAGQTPTVNDSEAGPDGRLWLATETGNMVYQPSKVAPQIFLDHVLGVSEQSGSPGGRMQVECERDVTIGIAWRDDSPAPLPLRYRINSGKWQLANSDPDPQLVQILFASPGPQVVDLQCYDGESNYSNVLTLEFEAFYPLWRNPRMRAAAGCIAVLALAVISHLTWLNYRTRQERNQIRENLLAEESRARKNAEEASKEREMLLGRVCHDLRNPLGVVGMVSDLLRSAETDRETMVELLDGSAQSMSYLTEQLLTYVQSRGGGVQPRPTPVELSNFLHRHELAGKLRLKASEVELTTRVDPSLPAVVVMDPDMMTEVLNNLFENAVRHTTTGSIALECHPTPDSRLQFTLTDSGSGMCQETLATIFQPFYRGESRPIHHSPGVGLGMFVVHELVNCMHGQIGISSQLGVGTTVRITLPLVTAPIDEPQPNDSKFDSQPIA